MTPLGYYVRDGWVIPGKIAIDCKAGIRLMEMAVGVIGRFQAEFFNKAFDEGIIRLVDTLNLKS